MQDAGLCLVLLSAQPDSFMGMADAARQFRAEVNDNGALQVTHYSPCRCAFPTGGMKRLHLHSKKIPGLCLPCSAMHHMLGHNGRSIAVHETVVKRVSAWVLHHAGCQAEREPAWAGACQRCG